MQRTATSAEDFTPTLTLPLEGEGILQRQLPHFRRRFTKGRAPSAIGPAISPNIPSPMGEAPSGGAEQGDEEPPG